MTSVARPGTVDPRPAPPWPDRSIRRVLDAAPDAACPAAARLWSHDAGDGAEMRFPGRLRVHRWNRPTPVELVVAAWSESKTEVRLELRTMHVPGGYFDRAHAVVDSLSAELSAALSR